MEATLHLSVTARPLPGARLTVTESVVPLFHSFYFSLFLILFHSVLSPSKLHSGVLTICTYDWVGFGYEQIAK